MPAPSSSRYYFLPTAFRGTNHGGTSLVPTTTNQTTWGWNVGQLTASTWCQMDFGVEVARTSVEWEGYPTASTPNNVIGNCFVMGPFNGDFEAGTMRITMSIKATTSATGQDGRFIYRFWKSDDPTGIDHPAPVDPNFFSSSIGTNLTTTPQVLTSSFQFPAFSMHNQWLFLHTQWGITGIATNNNADADMVFGAASSSITLLPFTSHPFYPLTLIQEEFPS